MHSRTIRTMGRILSVACTVGLGTMSLMAQDAPTTTQPTAPATTQDAPAATQPTAPATTQDTPATTQPTAPATTQDTPATTQPTAPATTQDTPATTQPTAPATTQDTPATTQPAAPATTQDTPAATQPTAPAAAPMQDTSGAAKPMAPMAPMAAPISRMDIFTGYSYLAPHGSVTTPNAGPCEFCTGTNSVIYPLRAVDYGALGSIAYFANKYIGGQLEVGAHPDSNNRYAPSDHFYTGQIGLIGRFPTDMGFTPWVHGLAGVVYGGGPDHQKFTFGPALTAGGGMDYDLPFFNHHLGLRLFQADYEYFHIDYGPGTATKFGGRMNSNVARLSTGLIYHMGSIIPPPPVMYSCTVSPASVFPGDPVTVTGTATNLNPKKTATYTWTAQGVVVKGDSTTGTIDTSNAQPGTFTITGHVAESQKPGRFADCTATLTVKPFEPPTISCSANPTTVKPGDTATITAAGVSPQNRPLTYTYSTSAGQINGTGTTATLATTGAPAGSITVTCNTADDKGQTASATTTVSVEAPPPPPAPKTQALCSINFERDKKRPARVDNEAKACLDSVALSAKGQSDATVVVVGEAGPDEKPTMAAQRGVNAKAYLTTEQGVDASRITVRTGTKGTKEAESYLVPAGAAFETDTPGTTVVDESTVKAQSRKAVAHGKRHHHKRAKKAM